MQQARTYFLLTAVLFVFVVTSLMPFYAVLGGGGTSSLSANASSLFGEKILICTSAGYQWVSLAYFEKDAVSEPSDQHSGYLECPLCYLVEDDLTEVVDNHIHLVEIYEHWQASNYRFFTSPQYIQRLLFSGRHTRAPPHFIG